MARRFSRSASARRRSFATRATVSRIDAFMSRTSRQGKVPPGTPAVTARLRPRRARLAWRGFDFWHLEPFAAADYRGLRGRGAASTAVSCRPQDGNPRTIGHPGRRSGGEPAAVVAYGKSGAGLLDQWRGRGLLHHRSGQVLMGLLPLPDGDAVTRARPEGSRRASIVLDTVTRHLVNHAPRCSPIELHANRGA
jgi:hypothetical protein